MSKAFLAFLADFKDEIIKETITEMEAKLLEKYSVKKEYYSLQEVSHLTGLTVLAIKGRYRRGTLEVVRAGQTPLIPADGVNRLLDKLNRQRRNKQKRA